MKKDLATKPFTLFRINGGVLILRNKVRYPLLPGDPHRKVGGHRFRLLSVHKKGCVASVLVTPNSSKKPCALHIKWGYHTKFVTLDDVRTFKKRPLKRKGSKNLRAPLNYNLRGAHQEIDFFGPMGTKSNGRDYTSPPP